MNKKLLAAAVGATLAMAPVFSAQAAKVKLYGKALVEVVNIDGDTIDRVDQGDRNNRSRWGIKAHEDLGNGMKAFANFEFSVRPAISGDGTSDSGMQRRVMKIGLKGGFGTLTFGRDHGVYKKYGGKKWDPVSNTFLQARRAGALSGGSFGHNSFRDDLIGYKTPKGLGGFTFEGQVRVDDGGGKDGEWHGAVRWENGPITVVGAMNNKEPTGEQNKKIAARYKSGGLTVFGQYEDVEIGDSIRPNGHKISTTGTGNIWIIGVGYKFGNNLVHGQFGGYDGDADAGTDQDTDYVSISVTHFMSKKTRVYAGYTNIDIASIDDIDMLGAGIRFDF